MTYLRAYQSLTDHRDHKCKLAAIEQASVLTVNRTSPEPVGTLKVEPLLQVVEARCRELKFADNTSNNEWFGIEE